MTGCQTPAYGGQVSTTATMIGAHVMNATRTRRPTVRTIEDILWSVGLADRHVTVTACLHGSIRVNHQHPDDTANAAQVLRDHGYHVRMAGPTGIIVGGAR